MRALFCVGGVGVLSRALILGGLGKACVKMAAPGGASPCGWLRALFCVWVGWGSVACGFVFHVCVLGNKWCVLWQPGGASVRASDDRSVGRVIVCVRSWVHVRTHTVGGVVCGMCAWDKDPSSHTFRAD